MPTSKTFYFPLASDEEKQFGTSTPSKEPSSRWKDITLAVLLSLNIGLIVTLSYNKSLGPRPGRSDSLIRPDATANESLKYTFNSNYSSSRDDGQAGMDMVEAAWNQIVPAHGIVALNHEWAKERGLSEARNLPGDDTKGVYILDAYHQIHCLTIFHSTMFQLARKEPLTYPFGHATHCLDAVRQYIMCTADDTPLPTMDGAPPGNGQSRKCRSWASLRDWAHDHSACFRDSKTRIAFDDHFGFCRDDGDGLII